jgi:hypothetical protein
MMRKKNYVLIKRQVDKNVIALFEVFSYVLKRKKTYRRQVQSQYDSGLTN